ncbi:MAG: protein kinase [Deltaproteobacteria bacterium]|nr:protein kinase [Deltaproteobacteria bacterium]
MSRSMGLVPGMMVTPSVRLVEKRGEGGMGSVWVADHLSLRTRVAVKFITPELYQQNPELSERFGREASLAAQIKSPHVVQIFDHGRTEDGTPFIVMELLEGESIEDRLKRDGKLGLRETVGLVSQVAKALGRAHKLGIVHRDIKPANLFLVESEYELFVKVLDFGIAKQTGMPPSGGLTATGAIIGTPEFMSPEQLLDTKGAGSQADLWALAVVAYEALTGRLPFSGSTVAALIIAITKAQFAAPSEICPDLPVEIDAWFRRALAQDVQGRFGSAKEMALALVRATRSWADGVEDALMTTGEHNTLGMAVAGPPGGAGPNELGSMRGPVSGRSPVPVIKGIEAVVAGPGPGEVARERTLPGGIAGARPPGRAEAPAAGGVSASGPSGTLVARQGGSDGGGVAAAGPSEPAAPAEPVLEPAPPASAGPRVPAGDTLVQGHGPSTMEASASTLRPAGVPRGIGRGAVVAIAGVVLLGAGSAAIALSTGGSVAPAGSERAAAGSAPEAAPTPAPAPAAARAPAAVASAEPSASASPAAGARASTAGAAKAAATARPETAPAGSVKGGKNAERNWGF